MSFLELSPHDVGSWQAFNISPQYRLRFFLLEENGFVQSTLPRACGDKVT